MEKGLVENEMLLKKIYLLFVLAIATMTMYGCSSWAYDYYKTDRRLDRTSVHSSSWKKGDSSLIRLMESDSLLTSVYFKNYVPMANSLKDKKSTDSTQNAVWMEGHVQEQSEPFSVWMQMKFSGNPRALGHDVDGLYVDVFGCTDFDCKNAQKVVLHDEFYEYTKVLEKGEFEILKPQKSFSVDEHGYACEVTKEYHFRLKINLKDFKLDADFQKGEETCYEKDMVCIIC